MTLNPMTTASKAPELLGGVQEKLTLDTLPTDVLLHALSFLPGDDCRSVLQTTRNLYTHGSYEQSRRFDRFMEVFQDTFTPEKQLVEQKQIVEQGLKKDFPPEKLLAWKGNTNLPTWSHFSEEYFQAIQLIAGWVGDRDNTVPTQALAYALRKVPENQRLDLVDFIIARFPENKLDYVRRIQNMIPRDEKLIAGLKTRFPLPANRPPLRLKMEWALWNQDLNALKEVSKILSTQPMSAWWVEQVTRYLEVHRELQCEESVIPLFDSFKGHFLPNKAGVQAMKQFCLTLDPASPEFQEGVDLLALAIFRPPADLNFTYLDFLEMAEVWYALVERGDEEFQRLNKEDYLDWTKQVMYNQDNVDLLLGIHLLAPFAAAGDEQQKYSMIGALSVIQRLDSHLAAMGYIILAKATGEVLFDSFKSCVEQLEIPAVKAILIYQAAAAAPSQRQELLALLPKSYDTPDLKLRRSLKLYPLLAEEATPPTSPDPTSDLDSPPGTPLPY